MVRVSLSLSLASLLVLAGCGSSETSSTPDAASDPCLAIIEACHEVDPGFGEIHECHEGAHEGTDPNFCSDNVTRCVAICESFDGDAGLADVDADVTVDEGTEDAGVDVDAAHSHEH